MRYLFETEKQPRVVRNGYAKVRTGTQNFNFAYPENSHKTGLFREKGSSGTQGTQKCLLLTRHPLSKIQVKGRRAELEGEKKVRDKRRGNLRTLRFCVPTEARP